MCKAIHMLGLHMTLTPLDVREKLPLTYSDQYAFFRGSFADQRCILLRYQGGYISVPRIQKHFREIPKLLYMDAPCALWLKNATEAQQTRLVENQIPFVVDDKTIFLPFSPFLSMRLNVRRNSREYLVTERFTPSAQCVFLWLLYQDSRECRVREIKEKLRLSQATVSRALMDLHERKLLEVSGRNTRKKYRRIDRRAFWEKGQAYLINPVHQKYYTDDDEVFLKIKSYTAGESALANLSMLSEPAHACRAVDTEAAAAVKAAAAESPDDLFTEAYSMIEVWRYDPGLFADVTNNVDIFSLYASLGDLLEDERVAGEIEHLIERYFNDSGS